jgi:photosystem II stability/assembly factor-like uncharacterized protein
MSAAHRVYVGTIGNGLWRSTDAGESFKRASDGMFVECHVRALVVDPRDDRTLWLGSEQGLFRSSDAADSWQRVESPLNGQQIWSILVLPQLPDVILAGTCPSRLFRSEDGGRAWTEPEVRMLQGCPRIMHSRVTTLVADPADPACVWAGVEIDGLYRSGDMGKTWHKMGRGLSSQDVHGMAIVPGNGQSRQLLVSTNNDLNASSDGGETWQPLRVGQSLPWSYCRALAQKAGQPEVVLMGNGEGPPGGAGAVARSTDAGRSWQLAGMPGRSNSTMWNFAVHPSNPEQVYASSISGEVYHSLDGGTSWRKLAREFGEIRALAWTPG